MRDVHQEAFCKDSDLVKHIRQTYFRAHWLVFDREVTHELTNVFKELAEMAGLLDTEIHQVQGKKELSTANCMARGSAKDLHYFQMVSPMESPKIMGLKGIHSPEALKHLIGLSFCPWCRKEGQNEGTMVNHLHTRHYCLRLICEQCLLYFITSSDAMWCHAQGCQSMHVCNGKLDEESDGSP